MYILSSANAFNLDLAKIFVVGWRVLELFNSLPNDKFFD